MEGISFHLHAGIPEFQLLENVGNRMGKIENSYWFSFNIWIAIATFCVALQTEHAKCVTLKQTRAQEINEIAEPYKLNSSIVKGETVETRLGCSHLLRFIPVLSKQ